ncbi:MAG: anaerobic sulfite reductase subunit AsrA [Defluviitaleaceae bacterium]|nr:anaerobic sulfite reductase subunit AsrA [Defluviitaleaceae bacterium]
MELSLTKARFNDLLEHWSGDCVLYAPKLFEHAGSFSDTDQVRYSPITRAEDIVFDTKSTFSHKEALLPITQILFYFTEDVVKEAEMNKQKQIIFLRSCDFHAIKRLDEIYLKNKFEDIYYKKFRENTKFIVMGCKESFGNCFCVSMNTNTCTGYDGYLHQNGDKFEIIIKNSDIVQGFNFEKNETATVTPQFVTENPVVVNIPEKLDLQNVVKSEMWEEYHNRCIACGRCNFVCPTCTCFSTQDIAYTDNGKVGERRRVWASCEVDGFTDMAGGHSFRENKGQRMRFKVLHKIYDYKKRFGYHMCVGCGRCDDVCPEYISYTNCVNKLNKLEKTTEEVK